MRTLFLSVSINMTTENTRQDSLEKKGHVMPRLSALVICYSVLVLWCDHARAEEFDLNDLKSRTARSAVSVYQRKVEGAEKDLKKVVSAAKKDHEKIVAKEREKLIDVLEAALKKETTDGNLEEAIKLKAAIADLKSQTQTEDSDKQTAQLIGVWKIQYNDGVVRYNQFLLKNGQPFVLRYVNPKEKSTDEGAVAIQSGTVLVKYRGYPGVDRFNITGDRMFVEHWVVSRNSSIDRYPNLLGIATKVEPENKK